MQKNFGDFSMRDALRLSKTPAGQQLLALLQQTQPDAMRKAMEQASKGDMSQMQETLAPILASEEVQKLLQQLGG